MECKIIRIIGDTMLSNKEIQKKRMMLYFINAAEEIIDETGFSSVTLRNVAKRAGFNSATLYNYFENLDHLLFFAAMRNIKDYPIALNRYLIDAKNSMDIFLKVWECFCDHAYAKPEIYNAIFYPALDSDVEEYIVQCIEFFPEDFVSNDEDITHMLLKRNITERGKITLIKCIKEGYILEEDAPKLNDMTLLVFEGILRRVLNNKIGYEDARKDTMEYIKFIVESFLIKDYEFYY